MFKRTSLFIAIAATLFSSSLHHEIARVTVENVHPVHCERFGSATNLPLLILLHGVSGPSSFYREQADFFARHGFRVVLPHYLEGGHGPNATDENYDAWVAAVREVMYESDSAKGGRPPATVIVGYSLGASVALALGSQGQGPDAIAEFYGSLPDKYFRDLKDMPPLLILHGELDKEIPVYNARQLSQLCSDAALKCDMHIYPTEAHGFTLENLKDADQRTLRFFSQIVARRSAPFE
ncbi:MAG TPA: alpha/beta fold hydrolase [Edaphobacter sp.]|nr:alpha/beta fold hydrolase [Edaphobacter sp.]